MKRTCIYMKLAHWSAKCVALPVLTLTVAFADNTGTDPAHKYAWGENVGWANAAPTNAGQTVVVHYYEGTGGWISGYVWGENFGWIKMGSNSGGPYDNTSAENWGVNLAADGSLSGYAWGENIGWINFGHAHCDAIIDPVNGAFSGHAWGENIGWLKFSGGPSPDYGVRSMAFYTQPQGTPNWWLEHHDVTENFDAGDGVPASDKFVMNVDPNVVNNALRITSIESSAGVTHVAFSPSSASRYYTLKHRAHLTEGNWSNVVGQVIVPGEDHEQVLRDDSPQSRTFYTIQVQVTP
ncbi:MAG: hypothetical protein K9N49_03430 [Candidatus Marinimicrobia bacterium]|nr:hypothetical protein [Candidatus Neomarinimicrobiota bacterium]